MKKLLLCLLLLIVLTLSAETSGQYGLQMLKIISGANQAGQGGGGAFSSHDGFAFLLNPAAGLVNSSHVISMTQNYWIFSTRLNSMAYNNSKGKTSLGLSYRYLDYGKILSRDDTGEIIGEFHPLDLSFSFNFAYRLTPDHYAGININGLYEKIDTSSSLGVSFDLGYAYLTPVKDLIFAAALKHLGKTGPMDKEELKLPLTGEISLIKGITWGNWKSSLEAKILQSIDDDGLKALLGLNISPLELLNLRLGYKFGYDAENFAAGIGITVRKIVLDYAFIPFDYGIDDVHMIGISYRF